MAFKSDLSGFRGDTGVEKNKNGRGRVGWVREKEVQGLLLRFSGSIRTCGMGFLESTTVGSFCHGLMGNTAYLYKPCGLSDEPLQMNAARIKAQAGQGRVGQGRARRGRAGQGLIL